MAQISASSSTHSTRGTRRCAVLWKAAFLTACLVPGASLPSESSTTAQEGAGGQSRRKGRSREALRKPCRHQGPIERFRENTRSAHLQTATLQIARKRSRDEPDAQRTTEPSRAPLQGDACIEAIHARHVHIDYGSISRFCVKHGNRHAPRIRRQDFVAFPGEQKTQRKSHPRLVVDDQ